MKIARHLGAAARLLAVMTVLLGLLYPMAITAAGRTMPHRADGSLVMADGRVAGHRVIGGEHGEEGEDDGQQWIAAAPDPVEQASAHGGDRIARWTARRGVGPDWVGGHAECSVGGAGPGERRP